MKSLFTTDLHTGEFSHGFIDESGLNSRLIDITNRFNKLVKYCKKNCISHLIIGGDIYDIKTPKNLIRKIFASLVKTAVENDLSLILLIGNHDISSSTGHALVELEELSSAIKGLTIISTPQIIEIGNVEIAFFPWNPFNNQQQNHEQLQLLADKITKRSILLGHFATNKNAYNELEKQENIDFEFLKSLEFDIVFLGHIHKRDQLAENIWHISSFTRTSFNEENEMKYVVEFDHDSFDYEFIEFDDRQFKTFSYDSSKDFELFKQQIENEDLSELVTRMHVTIAENDINHDEIDRLVGLVKEKSWKFSGIVKDIIKTANASFSISEKTTPEVAFKMYCEENSDMLGAAYNDCLKEGIAILNDVRGI